MKNKRKLYTPEEIAKNEPPITEYVLLAEVKTLLEDYFIGQITLKDNGITYSLPNGQKFILKVQAA